MISIAEIFIIVLIILVVFGPKRLPQLAQYAGKTWSALMSLHEEVHAALNGEVRKSQLEENIVKAKQADLHYSKSDCLKRQQADDSPPF